MNRVLKTDDNKFRVLVSPGNVADSRMETMMNHWGDAKLRGYKVVEFQTLQSAMDLAYRMPIVDWNKLVSQHVPSFGIIERTVKDALIGGTFIVEVDSHLMNPTELKETMFTRVSHHGERFNLYYNANDIICINIINPWTKNLIEIANTLKTIPSLRVQKIYRTPTHISLLGLTDIGTTYEIRLWTEMMAQWARWIHANKLNPNDYIDTLTQLRVTQKTIDDNDMIR